MKNESAPAASKLVLAALAGSILLAALGVSIATVALPTLARAFSAGVQQVQWVVLAYLLAVTAAIVVAGRMGDLYGNRRVLVAGLVLFTSASAACALAPGLGWLIAGRVAQGLGAAILMSLPMSIAKGLVAKERMGTAMGLFGAMSAIGTALGPSLGGVVIGALGWRAAFIMLTLCGAGMLTLALRGVPAERRESGAATNRMDWAGSLWLSILLLCFALAATGSKVGVAIQPWMLLAPAAVALLAFVRTESAAAHPLVPVALVRGRVIVVALVMNLLVGAVMMSTLVVGPFFLSFGLGLSEAETGMVMAVGPIAAALAGVPAGWVTDRFGASRTLPVGLLLAAGGLYGFAVLPVLIGVPGYVVALALITPGFQLFLAANNTAVMAAAADEHRGLFSGLLGLTRNLGFMAGASLLPLLFASLLGGHDLAGSSTQAVGEAFSTTFLAAAGLCALAFFLALLGNTSWRPACP
ncbi:MFS transporter [Thauera sp. SDU_THAU2]|uniref:MFS transporter n=1 Tax=Thauera sp. SDU_THAU2 TaxID=3136633 RepID=UPI003120553D